MKWVTREKVKVDRVACPWLIRNFVDPQAEFFFFPAVEVRAKAEELQATGRSRARSVLVGAQIALCTVLLISTGLLVRSLQKLLAMEPGCSGGGVLTAQVSLTGSNRNVSKVTTFADEYVRRLRRLPGVTAASLTHVAPLSGINTRSEFTHADRPPAKPSDTLSAANRRRHRSDMAAGPPGNASRSDHRFANGVKSA